MKQAVMYGAGNIGRGFIGQLFHMSGYRTTFIDINAEVIDRLNADGGYPIYITEGDGYRIHKVTNACGVNGRDCEAVACAIANADVMATAVGVHVLAHIAKPFAMGVRRRMEMGIKVPLNVIICENMIEADRYFASLVREHLLPEEQRYFEQYVGLVEPSIGRMVPATPRELAMKNPLSVCVEPYCELPVDRTAFVGEIPPIVNLCPFSPFDFHIRRKLFLHNMSHAITAYFGARMGYTYIWEAIADPAIRAVTRTALRESSRALSKEYGVPEEELYAFSEELIERYDNRLLGDTVERVGRDSARKLSKNDRFVGAIELCRKHGIEPRAILAGLGAGYLFSPEGDPASQAVAQYAKEQGLAAAMGEYSGLLGDLTAYETARITYTALESGENPTSVLTRLGLI